jgi:hypothetical protein
MIIDEIVVNISHVVSHISGGTIRGDMSGKLGGKVLRILEKAPIKGKLVQVRCYL